MDLRLLARVAAYRPTPGLYVHDRRTKIDYGPFLTPEDAVLTSALALGPDPDKRWLIQGWTAGGLDSDACEPVPTRFKSARALKPDPNGEWARGPLQGQLPTRAEDMAARRQVQRIPYVEARVDDDEAKDYLLRWTHAIMVARGHAKP
jgi:hypothetical protein